MSKIDQMQDNINCIATTGFQQEETIAKAREEISKIPLILLCTTVTIVQKCVLETGNTCRTFTAKNSFIYIRMEAVWPSEDLGI